MNRRAASAWLLLATALAAARAQEAAPLESGLEERVRVRLVLLDVVVLDRKGRTIPDLNTDDFELFVGGRETTISSLDLHCPQGQTDDPRGGDAEGRAVAASPDPRRIVLVFDYYHIENAARAIDAAERALDRWTVGGEEHMVVTLGHALRVEQPFTFDTAEVHTALDRMRRDVHLYGGNHGTLTNWPFFRRMESLMDVLEQEPGRKAVVLFSGPFAHDGFWNDQAYRTLAAMAASSRSAVYPVDSGGLRTPFDPLNTRRGGPEKLRRLAVETGGRMTHDTNDVALAYGRAHRDQGCRYTLGFYDRSPELDRRRRVSVYVRKNHHGLRLLYPTSYVIRSADRKRRSLVRTASMAPQMFRDDGLVARLIPIGPASPTRWDALIALEVRTPRDPSRYEVEPAGLAPLAASDVGAVDTSVSQDRSETEEWVVHGFVHNSGGTALHSFRRSVPASDEHAGAVRLFDRVRLAPGTYTVSAVLWNRAAVTPLATRSQVEVPPIPLDALFLVGPILGRESDSVADERLPRRERRGLGDLVRVAGSDEDARFEPLVAQRSARGAPLAALTRVCFVPTHGAAGRGEISRHFHSTDGEEAGRFDPVRVDFDPDSKPRCEDLVDDLPGASLHPGDYRMTAVVDADRTVTAVSAPLTILPAD